jgi:RPA family protein
MALYDIGDQIRINGVFTDSEGDAVDNATVEFSIKDPSGNVVTYIYPDDDEIVKDGVGEYHYLMVIGEAGWWWYRWEGTGSGATAMESYFEVRESNF